MAAHSLRSGVHSFSIAPGLFVRKSTPEQSINDQNLLGQFIPLQYHYNMLQDEDRVGAFRSAIESSVRCGMHVVELGGGTGILSSFAARMGANVTCVERNPELVQCARRLVRENGLQDQIEVVQADATQYIPDIPVDVVVCEMLHVALLREKQTEVIDAFKQNYVRSFGSTLPKFLPEASILMCQPVEQSFDFAGYHAPVPLFQAPLVEQPRTQELSALSPYATFAYDERIPQHFRSDEPVVINQAGTLNAVRFVTQNVITVDLAKQNAVTWPNQCLVLPIETPTHVDCGQTIDITFSYAAGGSIQQLADSLCVQHGSSHAQRQASPA